MKIFNLKAVIRNVKIVKFWLRIIILLLTVELMIKIILLVDALI